MMSDAFQYFGSDLSFSAAGDLLMTSGLTQSNQRVIRRLLTAAGGYIWELPYGAGLGQQVGGTLGVAAITNLVRGQIFQEATVAKVPEPVISVSATTSGVVNVTITYVDAVTGQPQILTLPPG